MKDPINSAIVFISLRSSFKNGPSSDAGLSCEYETQRCPIASSRTTISADCLQAVSINPSDLCSSSLRVIQAWQTSGYCQPGGIALIIPLHIFSIGSSNLLRISWTSYKQFNSLALSLRSTIIFSSGLFSLVILIS